jgi:hypothetical protein
VFDSSGKALEAIGRPGGRALLGHWTPDGLRFISGMAVASDGRLWVAENDPFPRRISAWDTKTGALWKECFGPTDYGALGGAIDPLDPNVMVGMGCEWKLDPATGRSSCVAVITRDGMANSRFGVGASGRLYLAVAPQWMDASATSIFERIGDGGYKLRAKFHFDGPDTRYWADANGDEQEQPGEVTTVPGTLRFSGWYMAFLQRLQAVQGHRIYSGRRSPLRSGAPGANARRGGGRWRRRDHWDGLGRWPPGHLQRRLHGRPRPLRRL